MFRISDCTVERTACFDDGQISDFHQFKCRISENAMIIRFRPLFFFFVLSGLILMLLKVLTESVYLPKTERLVRKHGTQCRCFAHTPIARWCHPTADPTKEPTSDPSNDPSIDPTADPTIEPTRNPTIEATSDPTRFPTVFADYDAYILMDYSLNGLSTANKMTLWENVHSVIPSMTEILEKGYNQRSSGQLEYKEFGLTIDTINGVDISSLIPTDSTRRRRRRRRLISDASKELYDALDVSNVWHTPLQILFRLKSHRNLYRKREWNRNLQI